MREKKTHCLRGHEIAVVGRHRDGGCHACRNERAQTAAGIELKRRANARRDASSTNSLQRARAKQYLAEAYAESPEKRIPVTDVSRVVVLSDLQIPFEDPPAVEQALGVIDVVKPDLVILNGDIVDCYQMSSFDKNPRHRASVTQEGHERTRLLLECLAHVLKKIWLGGNHEARFRRLVWEQYARLGGLDAIGQELLAAFGGTEKDLAENPDATFARLYSATEFGFEYYPYGYRLYLAEGNLVVTHGKYVSRHSGQSAKRTLEWLGRSCIVGHTHRMGNHLVSQDAIPYGAWENGCLCQLEPEYDDTPNWQQGFSVVRISGPEFHVIQVPIVRRNGAAVAVYHGEGA